MDNIDETQDVGMTAPDTDEASEPTYGWVDNKLWVKRVEEPLTASDEID